MVNGGKVVEQGTHDELLKNAKGLYFKLVQVRARVRVRVRARARVRARVRVRARARVRFRVRARARGLYFKLVQAHAMCSHT